MTPIGYINIPRDVFIQENPCSFEYRLMVTSIEDLDRIIEQCRDIKLKMMEEKK